MRIVFLQVKHFRALQEQANTYLDLLCSMCDLSDATVKSTAADIQQTKQTVQDNHINTLLILFRALNCLYLSSFKKVTLGNGLKKCLLLSSLSISLRNTLPFLLFLIKCTHYHPGNNAKTQQKLLKVLRECYEILV